MRVRFFRPSTEAIIRFINVWDFFGIATHWNFPERKDTDIVMEKNANGIYEVEKGCPACSILYERNLEDGKSNNSQG